MGGRLADAVETSAEVYENVFRDYIARDAVAPVVVRGWRGNTLIADAAVRDLDRMQLAGQSILNLLGCDMTTYSFDVPLAGNDFVVGRPWDDPWPIDPDGSIGRCVLVYGANRAGDTLYRRARWDRVAGEFREDRRVRENPRVRRGSIGGWLRWATDLPEVTPLDSEAGLRDSTGITDVPWRELMDIVTVINLAREGVPVHLEVPPGTERERDLSRAAAALRGIDPAGDWHITRYDEDDSP